MAEEPATPRGFWNQAAQQLADAFASDRERSERIAARTPAKRQTVLFSATLDGAIGRLAGKLLRDPSLYTNADQMLIETRGLVKSIRENPKTYLTIHFKVF